jgi:selenocysteine-specific elongation factor
VPGHDRLVGNMLVGAGEIDAALLVVAADDGPRAQTVEHLELLDALGLRFGVVAITKADLVTRDRIDEVRGAIDRLLAGTALAGSPVLDVSSVDGRGVAALAAALAGLRDRVAADPRARLGSGSRLAIDRVFSIKGRGLVVTGSLRGAQMTRNATLRLVPGERDVRAREVQVHGLAVTSAGPGRTALNLAGIDAVEVHRGLVLTNDTAVVATDRLLVRLSAPLPDRTRVRVHLGTASTGGSIGRAGRDAIDLADAGAAAIVRLAAPLASAPGDRFVLRRDSGTPRIVGGIVLDVAPARGISRRRQTAARVARLAAAIEAGDAAEVAGARLDLHGAVPVGREIAVAADVAAGIATDILQAVVQPDAGEAGPTLPAVRALVARRLRRLVTLRREPAGQAAASLVDRLIEDGRVERNGGRLRLPGLPAAPAHSANPAAEAAMDRLERALAVSAPPPLADAARAAGCLEAGIHELERLGRIVVLDREIAYAAATYRDLEERALDLARLAPLTPAVLRDATGTSRKYVLAILADLDRRGLLRRTEAGHVPGPRAPSTAMAASAPPRAP